MKVLVTGGTGFVGSHSVRALLATGHQVRLLARDPARVTTPGVEVAVGPGERVMVMNGPFTGVTGTFAATAARAAWSSISKR